MTTPYCLSEIHQMIGGELIGKETDSAFSQVFYDTRTIQMGQNGVFFALISSKNDGHLFLSNAYQKGVRNFVVSNLPNILWTDANFLVVPNTLIALQQWAKCHCQGSKAKIIAITGSNGKTIVKEWLYELLKEEYNIIRSPKSFNSQIGVALSLLAIEPFHNLAIIEAGISQPKEMELLCYMIEPTLTVITNVGKAHAENFDSKEQHIEEKIQLTQNSEDIVIPSNDQLLNHKLISTLSKKQSLFTWGNQEQDDLKILKKIENGQNIDFEIEYNNQLFHFSFHFQDQAHQENLLTCLSICCVLNISLQQVLERVCRLHPIQMRMEFLQGKNGSMLINDSYTSDIFSLKIGLEILSKQPHKQKTVILSDILQNDKNKDSLYLEVASLLHQFRIGKGVFIGSDIRLLKNYWNGCFWHYPSTDEFLKNRKDIAFRGEAVLIKGARSFYFEKITNALQLQQHETVFEINLNSLVHNLNAYKSKLKRKTKIMAMAKAFSYGAGSIEIAKTLQLEGVDYLTVAYIDEGITLRENGIHTPILVLNPSIHSFAKCIEYKLEPEIYSMRLLAVWETYSTQNHSTPIHIKLETGMNRLGFTLKEIQEELIPFLKEKKTIKIASLFTHLSSTSTLLEEEFTKQQISIYETSASTIEKELKINPIRHVLNSSGILNYIDYQMDMVRLGVGLYGYDPTQKIQDDLMCVGIIRSTISQIKLLKKGENVGYDRTFKALHNMKIATVPIGYADGIRRGLSNGKGYFMVSGNQAKIVGTVCMDMTMIDITNIPCEEGDEIIVFGEKPSIYEIATQLNTIPNEILSGISTRVKRVYVYE